MKSSISVGAFAVAVALSLTAALGAGATRSVAAPPSAMFKSGYNKCKLATPAALSKTTAKKFVKAKFDGKTCTWSSSDGNYVVLVDTHPAGYLEFLGPTIGKSANGDVTKLIRVPGASKAVLETFSHANTHRYAKDLFAVYPQGVVQVSINYSTALPDKTVVAVTRLVTHT
jgi:hypothetical protein